MGTEEKIDEMFKEELANAIGTNKIIDFPTAVSVETDELSDIGRWREHE